MPNSTLPKRSEVAPEQTWDVESIFATPSDWEAAFNALASRLGELDEFRDRLGESAATLYAAIQRLEDLMKAAWELELYAHMRVAEDATNPASLALGDRADGMFARVEAAAAFVEPEILAIDPETLASWVATDDNLKPYTHYFDKLGRRRDHVRSAEVEQVLAMASEPLSVFSSVRMALAEADLKLGSIDIGTGETVELGQGNLDSFIHNADRKIRQAAWETSADAYLSMKNTFAANYSGAVKQAVMMARVRNYDTALEASLSPNAIPLEVFHNLLDTVWKNFPTWQRYFKVRAKLLGVEQAHVWDISESPLQPVGAPPQRKITFNEGIDIVSAAVAPLGEEYVRQVQQGIECRWVDYAVNAGKVGGAFSTGMPGHHPFIMMSWHDDLGSVSTLIHELGHSLHSYYTWETQPLAYANYSMFVAEVASNMNQALMGAHLLETVDDPHFLTTVIEERMGNNLRYLFTMPILAKFELETHTLVENGEALTADGMIDLMADLYAQAYGDAVVLDRPRSGITWARFPHLFANFYVFQYATGIAAAAQLAQQVREGGPEAAARYIEFLKTGDGAYPVEALKLAGIDMSTPAPIQAAFDILASYVDRLEQLVG
ncbi:MAG: oligoendopeptidase F [Thermomicrobiales bacterium]|nr:oligoendopeptidase F [Thermomicrobiales bacterium]